MTSAAPWSSSTGILLCLWRRALCPRTKAPLCTLINQIAAWHVQYVIHWTLTALLISSFVPILLILWYFGNQFFHVLVSLDAKLLNYIFSPSNIRLGKQVKHCHLFVLEPHVCRSIKKLDDCTLISINGFLAINQWLDSKLK